MTFVLQRLQLDGVDRLQNCPCSTHCEAHCARRCTGTERRRTTSFHFFQIASRSISENFKTSEKFPDVEKNWRRLDKNLIFDVVARLSSLESFKPRKPCVQTSVSLPDHFCTLAARPISMKHSIAIVPSEYASPKTTIFSRAVKLILSMSCVFLVLLSAVSMARSHAHSSDTVTAHQAVVLIPPPSSPTASLNKTI